MSAAPSPNLREAQPRVDSNRASRLLIFVGCMAVVYAAWVLINFPWQVDQPMQRTAQPQKYYTQAYRPSADPLVAESERERKYVRIAQEAAKAHDIEGMVKRFVTEHRLLGAKVLDVGSGRGYLQDSVADYTGLDISPSVARFYHKKFIVGSATDMPFEDNTFDAAWSIWVLEHIPNPESALLEIRRVLKPGGVLLLAPAWMCPPFAAQGYPVRPYSDFSWSGKIVKASLPFRSSPIVQLSHIFPVRALRVAAFHLSSSLPLRYRRLQPNYDEYWMPDSDAVNSIDALEARLWFESRGDACLNCAPGRMMQPQLPLIIRVQKSPANKS